MLTLFTLFCPTFFKCTTLKFDLTHVLNLSETAVYNFRVGTLINLPPVDLVSVLKHPNKKENVLK